MTIIDDRSFRARVLVSPPFGGEELTNDDIRSLELARARHALSYLKERIGNTRMRELLAADLQRTEEQVRAWLDDSDGQWQSESIELVITGVTAGQFVDWYDTALHDRREPDFRAGHPEHFISHPHDDGIEVIENVGETELPWHVFYRSLPEDGDFPVAWDEDFPVRFGAEVLDQNRRRVGFSMRQARDTSDGMHLRVTSFLPLAASPTLMRNHLNHLAIEYRNWTRMSVNASHA